VRSLLLGVCLQVSPARAEEVATFYVMFNTKPVGRHVVEICTNVSCCLTGADRIFSTLKAKLGVENRTSAAAVAARMLKKESEG